MPLENIGSREARKRLSLGVVAFIVSIAGYILLSGVDRFWRLLLFGPLLMATLGFFQAREKT